MSDSIELMPVARITSHGQQDIEDRVIKELPLTIILNNRELVTLLCSPLDLDDLAVGFLASAGLVSSKDEIKRVTVDQRRGVVRVTTDGSYQPEDEPLFKRVITSGCGQGIALYHPSDIPQQGIIESLTAISATEVFTLVAEFQHRSQVYRTTGGVHSAALCDTENILVFHEDIGRHNAIDKVFGECLMQDIATKDRIIITSGRISSEMLLKVAKRNIPILISKSAPTDMGVRLAGELGLTLIGFVRGKRMNIYANQWRVRSNGKS